MTGFFLAETLSTKACQHRMLFTAYNLLRQQFTDNQRQGCTRMRKRHLTARHLLQLPQYRIAIARNRLQANFPALDAERLVTP